MIPTQNYRKYYTVKQWNKFPIDMQEVLTHRYHVILTDHKTRKEKVQGMFTKKNLDRNIDRFQAMMKKMDHAWEQWDKMKNTKIFEGVSQKEYDEMFGKLGEKDYSSLIGKKRDYSKLTGK